ncbi:hypothetical protein [Brevibacterium moorei]|uniref:hypothetical protein n=1 Tax=Brevibacterium moorei TaxID=2968457 RepID=UPI00211C4027|nr:hypothetical protein [Brevibacterium sp. 68QC2CO]MCQ9384466.1 hypothetical protein [Brevibacterium sp. 68QC2CO]
MSGVIAFPFSIGPQGNVRTVDQGTEEEGAQVLTVIASTLLGERPMAEEFGIPDPVFFGFTQSDVQVVLSTFGFEQIELQDVRTVFPEEGVQRAEMDWQLSLEPTAEDLEDDDDDEDEDEGDDGGY